MCLCSCGGAHAELFDPTGLCDPSQLPGGDAVVAHACGEGHAHDGISRRGLLATGAAAAASLTLGARAARAATPAALASQAQGDRLVFLGTNGGPVINPRRALTSTVLVAGGTQYMVDGGYAVGAQMVKAQLDLAKMRHLFVTHHHSDHVADLPGLLLLTWYGSERSRTNLWGPPPLAHMVDLIPQLFSVDVKSRMEEGLELPFSKSVAAESFTLTERSAPRRTMQDRNVAVHSVWVPHGADIKHSYAYRFDIKKTGRSVVFSGDCTANNNLIKLADDADVLVHEIMSLEGANELIATVPKGKARNAFKEHLFTSHTTPDQLATTAKRANVKRVILHHYVPGYLPTDAFVAEVKAAAARKGYTGEIIGANDLDVLSV